MRGFHCEGEAVFAHLVDPFRRSVISRQEDATIHVDFTQSCVENG